MATDVTIIPSQIIPTLNYDKIIKTNKPNKIIIVDCRNSDVDIIQLNKIHIENGLLCFAYHYFIDSTGKIDQGRYEFMYPAKISTINDFTYFKNVVNSDGSYSKEIQLVDNMKLRPSDYSSIETIDTIYICLEGNTSIETPSYDQFKSVVSLCKNIIERHENIKFIYGLNEMIPKLKNPGILLDTNKIRSQVFNNILPVYCNTPSGNFTYTFGSRDFYYSSDYQISGNDVSLYQLYLSMIGFSSIKSNGIYDLRTLNSTKLFQKSFGLTDDGIVSTEEFNLIKSLIKEKMKSTNQFEFGRLLEYKENYNLQSGQDVKLIQEKLVELGFYKEDITSKYDKATFEAIKNFQMASGIMIDGKVGPITFNLIMTGKNVVFQGDFIYTENGIQTKRTDVLLIQKILKNNMTSFGLSSISVTGIYDLITMKNIKKIQIAQLMSPTGIVNETFYNFLLKFNK